MKRKANKYKLAVVWCSTPHCYNSVSRPTTRRQLIRSLEAKLGRKLTAAEFHVFLIAWMAPIKA